VTSKGDAGAQRQPRDKPKKDRTLSRAAEKNYRVHALLSMAVKSGYGPIELMNVATKGWKVSPTVAARLVAEAYELCISGTSLYDKLRMSAIQVARMEHLLRTAMQQKNLAVALGVNREINALILSVNKFEKAQEEAGDGGAGATPLTPEEQEAQDREGDF
jgi:hypothetical protein